MSKHLNKLVEEIKALSSQDLEQLKQLTGLGGVHTNDDHDCPSGQVWDVAAQKCVDKLPD